FHLLKSSFPRRPFIEWSCYMGLHEFYKAHQDMASALYYFEKADSVEDYQGSKASGNAHNLLELEYDSRIKKEQLATLSAEMAKVRNTRIFLIIGLLLTIFFSSALFYQQRQKARKKRAL